MESLTGEIDKLMSKLQILRAERDATMLCNAKQRQRLYARRRALSAEMNAIADEIRKRNEK